MTESVKSSSPPPAPPPLCTKRQIRRFLTTILVLSVLFPFLPNTAALWPPIRQWHEILLLTGIVLNSVLLIHRRRRAATQAPEPHRDNRFSRREILCWNAAGLVMVVLLICHAVRSVVAWTLMIGLRIGIPTIWLFVIIALPFAVRQILDRRRRPISRLVKLWFSLCLLTAVGEFTCLLIQRSQSLDDTRLAFPEQLPPADDNDLHIASTGGSTAMGWPWHPHYSIAQVAAWQLEQVLISEEVLNFPPSADEGGSPDAGSTVPRCKVVVHNVAREGSALKEAILQLHNLPLKPHVLMVYTGHNEVYQEIDELLRVGDSPTKTPDRILSASPAFRLIDKLVTEHFSALWRIRQIERRLVDVPYLPDEIRLRRLARFTDRMRQLSQFCQRENIKLFWFIPAASESACPPNRSTIRLGRSASLDAAYEKARNYEQKNEWALAAKHYGEQLKLFPDMAEFHYRLGHCLLHMNLPQDAAASFQAALETDAYPVRAQADHRQAVEQVAREFGNVTIDTAAVLRPLTHHGILDETVFLDDVHPTLRSTFALGTEAARVIHQLVPERVPYSKKMALMLRSLNERVRPAAPDNRLEEELAVTGSFRLSLRALRVDPAAVADAYETLAGVMPNRACLRFDHSHWMGLGERLRGAAADLRGMGSLPGRTKIESLQDIDGSLFDSAIMRSGKRIRALEWNLEAPELSLPNQLDQP